MAWQKSKEISQTRISLKNFLNDTTFRSLDPRFGTQIEFLAQNGQAYLLFPGNTFVKRGEWKITEVGPGSGPRVKTHLCFRYYRGARKTNDGVLGKWSCSPAMQSIYHIGELYDGDPLRLSSTHKLKSKLPKAQDVSISTMLKQWKLDPLEVPNKAPKPWFHITKDKKFIPYQPDPWLLRSIKNNSFNPHI